MTNVNATKDTMANYKATLGDRVLLFTAAPGQTISNEVSGGSPAYARKTTTWGTATGGTGLVTGSEVTFDVPAGTTVTHVGIAHSGGTFIDWADSADISFTPQGQVKVTPKIQAA